MRAIKTFAVALAMACVGTSGLAQSYANARLGAAIAAESWMPKTVRPYSAQELYFEPRVHQQIPQIRLTTIEAAYTKKPKDPRASYRELAHLTPQAICHAYVETLQKRHHGAAVRNHGCRVGIGWVAGKNTVHGAMTVNYHKGQTIVENLSMVITVCEPDEKYDPAQHICVPDENGGI